MIDTELQKFLASQKLMVLASATKTGKPWVANVYYSFDDTPSFYFLSAKDTRHSLQIEQNPHVAFSVVWHDQDNLGNRKGIQGEGMCEVLTGVKNVWQGLKVMYSRFPDWKKSGVDLEMLKKSLTKSRVYKITPSYIKHWDDELYGEDKTKEFTF